MGGRKRAHAREVSHGSMATSNLGHQPDPGVPGRNAVLGVMVAAATPESGGMVRLPRTLENETAGEMGRWGCMGAGSLRAGGGSSGYQGFADFESESQESYRRNRDYWLARGGWRNRACAVTSSGAFSNDSKRERKNRLETYEPEDKTPMARRGHMGLPFTGGEQIEGSEAEISEDFDDPGTNDGNGKPEELNDRKEDTRGSVEKAIRLVKRPVEFKKAKEAFVKKFLAANTRASRNSKRSKIMEITEALGCMAVFPLTRDTITLVGTALDEAKLQSGDQYINELKLMHVEEGHDWNAPLERQLALVKRALKRHRGPEQRANEVKPEDLSALTWEARSTRYRGHQRPAWSYAFACVWMLRAAEAVKVKVKHLRLDHLTKTVSLVIPFSKTDQRGKGVTRTLTCMCWEGQCERWCAWGLAVRSLAEHTKSDGEALLFLGVLKKGKAAVSKAQMVNGWTRDVSDRITGHSARRSGAMHYTREGLDVATIGFLGRWKSSAILRYVEEALSQLPANSKANQAGKNTQGGSVPGGVPDEKVGAEDVCKEHPPTRTEVTEKLIKEVEVKYVKAKDSIIIPADPEEEDMWAISTHARGRVAHVVTKAAWGLDLDEWQTHCGWHFAQKFVRVQLVRKPPKNTKICVKCGSAMKLRDGVKGGCSVAQLMVSSMSAKSST